ncbi:MAG: hypothetical protein HY348_07140 [Nitrospira defluvii]|nr:hypothetical protein [Nitrospira defluvii]
MNHCGAVVLLWTLGVLVAAAGPGRTYAESDREGDSSNAGQASAGLTVADTGGVTVNPHSDLIFRATDATSCLDCHRADKAGRVNVQVLDNALVQELKAKAKGIHGPGRFADCLRCHAGGNKGVEKYRK